MSSGHAGKENGNGNGEQKRHTQDEGRSLVEWITLGISLAILLGLAGLIVYEATVDDQQPTVIVVQPDFDSLRQEVNHFYLPVSIKNSGNRTVSAVEVQIRVEGEDGESESATLTVDYLAAEARVEGTVVFNVRPSTANTGVVVSYRRP